MSGKRWRLAGNGINFRSTARENARSVAFQRHGVEDALELRFEAGEAAAVGAAGDDGDAGVALASRQPHQKRALLAPERHVYDHFDALDSLIRRQRLGRANLVRRARAIGGKELD